jgi:hypothetical protein
LAEKGSGSETLEGEHSPILSKFLTFLMTDVFREKVQKMHFSPENI